MPRLPVALRKESVDRNVATYVAVVPVKVALRKESVDRNFNTMQIVIVVMVALRKESVDRNSCFWCILNLYEGSLSARRAWIEISVQCRL